jgi:hypothetical protein
MHPQDEALNDPDLSDYINGMVNTLRSANRNEREGRDPLVSGLLSNYLSAQGLGAGVGELDNNDADTALARLIRTTAGGGRNGDGPGIDIHIHAVVTGPGMLGGGTTTTATGTTTPLQSILRNGNTSSLANRALDSLSPPAPTQVLNEEDQGLFSELYSESPVPLNMHGSASATTNSNATALALNAEEGVCNDLDRAFEECRSIEGESSESGEESEVRTTTEDNAAAIVGIWDAVDSAVASNSPHGVNDAEPKTPTEGLSTQNNDEFSTNPTQAIASSSSNNSLLRNNQSINTISEIGSVDSSSPPSPLESSDHVSSPSFMNRLYSRTFGRLSRTNHRRSGGGNSA